MAEKPSDPNLRPAPKGTAPAEAPARTKSVLIADRDARENASLRNSLEACGYDVSAWTEVADAREKLAARPFDLVVLATNLGRKGMDDLLGNLRAMRVTPKVLLIADEDEGDAASCCFLRMVAVINRPLKLLEVTEIVEQLIGPA